MLPSQRLSNLVLIQSKVETDGAWNPAVEWVENRRVWVSVDPKRGREIFTAGEKEAVVTHTIRGDFLELEGVNETMRIVLADTHIYDPVPANALVFDILAVLPNYDGRDDTMIQAALLNRRHGTLPADIPQ